ncbi:MAG: 2-phosphosulfolactate phosphatase [Chloroflexi bacterium]|nr:2-phosphosulfolactate phosphatase [Chloroflexota bacterium]
MEIRIGSLLRGAQEARGTVVIVDVFRAFTTASVAFRKGAKKIVLVAEVDEALRLRENGVGEMCIGEVNGIRPDGFDMGNSPFEMLDAEVAGKTLIQSTRAGTVGMSAAVNASKIYAGSFVIAEATVKAILQDAPELVTIVAMGWEARINADEDEQCAFYMRNLLQGRQPDRDAVRALVLAGEESQKYGDPSQPQYHPEDRDIALQIDSVDFAIKVEREDGLLVARRRDLGCIA